ncbi:Subtilisin BL [Lachnellula arida]|uniref:Subtilisin BL n=1 Tax=Lachnellula arida TaxID=1316785 RepID=A0A8T9BCV6_9HELO|nr:Subtilisin BL [Lachnellula arida]
MGKVYRIATKLAEDSTSQDLPMKFNMGIRKDDFAIKIAIIDCGVDAWQPAIAENIKFGFSYIEQAPWYKPEDAHGTLMASLIRRINPWVRFHVYRVSSGRNDLNVNKAAKAIEHAANAGVDIINCSWTTEKDDAELQHAIEYATSHGGSRQGKHPALVFCATSDEPHHYKSVWPADYTSHVLSVSAASKSGRNRIETRMRFDLLVPGEDMPAAGLSENGDSDTLVSGSSVATAIASGIASMVLLYCKLLDKDEKCGGWHEFKRKDKILEVFKLMSHLTDNKERYVDPTLIFQDRFKKGWPRAEDKECGNVVALTWFISFKQICRQNMLAADYLLFMACTDLTNVPLALLPMTLPQEKGIDAVGTLDAYSFVTKRTAASVIDLHRLVHLSTRNWLQKNQELLSQRTQVAITRLLEVFPDSNHWNRSKWRRLLPHTKFALSSGAPGQENEARINLAHKQAMALVSDGKFTEAEAYFNIAL